MPAQISPTRNDVTDRFPMVAFRIRADGGTTRAEVAIGADPALFTPEGRKNRTAANFYSTKGNGAVRFAGDEASFTVPPEVLARFIGNGKLYYGLATAGEGGALKVAVTPTSESPYIKISGLSGRSMARVRVLPNRQQRAAGYNGNGQAQLEWAGDAAVPGLTPVANSALPNGHDKAAATHAPSDGAAGHAPYDDGFGPLPVAAVPAPAPLPVPAQGLGYPNVQALSATPVRITPPQTTTLGWVARKAAEAVIFIAPGGLGIVFNQMIDAANRLGCSVGMGPQVGGGLGAGGALGAGIVFGKDGDLGIYGSAEIDVGFITSISATAVITIVKGGIDAFDGWSYGLAISGGEGIVGGAMALLDGQSNFVGVSANIGIGAGFSPVDFFVAAQRGWSTRVQSLAQAAIAQGSIAQGLAAPEAYGRKPVAHAMVVGLEDRQKVRRYARDFIDLFQWNPPASVVSGLTARGFTVQTIDAAVGDLNLDFYKVQISRFADGWDAPRLLGQFIHNINSFINTSNTEFIPYDDSDVQKLASANPLGTVFKLDIVGPDNAAVVISDVNSQRYVVTTINTPWSGDHPVSGHRQFGYFVVDNLTTFYTRGADRATLGFPGTETLIYAGGEALWESFQSKLAAFINDNGGAATIVAPFSERFNPTAVREEFGHFDVTQSLGLGVAAGTSWTVNWDDVELVPQPTNFSCWAAAGAMLVGWRDRVSLTPESVGTICSRATTAGLDPAQVSTFGTEMGLIAEPPVSYSVEGFRDLLASQGPLWIAEALPGTLHAIIVTGIYSDGTNSFVRIADPWDRVVGTPGAPGQYASTHTTGSRYIMRYEDFHAQYEAAINGNPPNRQVLHSGNPNGLTANTGQTVPPPGYAQGMAVAIARQMPAARGLASSGQSFSINWDEVQQIAQPTALSCWATSAAMVLGWRDNMSLTVESIAEIGGRSTATGLDPAQVGQFATDMGMTAEAPQSYTIAAFRQLIARNGPLWVGAAVPGLHAIVVTGLYDDGNDVFVRITDPWDRAVGTPGAPGAYANTHGTGSRYIMRWGDFVAEYERAATDFAAVSLQILHSNGTFGHTPNTGGTVPVGYAMSANAAARSGALKPPPPPRARGLSDDTAPRSIGGAAIETVVTTQGNIVCELDHFRGPKHPGNVAAATGGSYSDAPTIKLEQWPMLDGVGGAAGAAFIIDWLFNGRSIGDVRINNSRSWNGEAALRVCGIVMDDNALYPPNDCAALKVRLTYRFQPPQGAEIVAVTDVQLYGDGTHDVTSQWADASTHAVETPRRSNPKPRARAMDGGVSTAIAVVGTAISLIGSGAVNNPSWLQTKHPGDTAPPGTRTWHKVRVPTRNVPKTDGPLPFDTMSANFTVEWEYDGLSLRNIFFYPDVNTAFGNDFTVVVDVIPESARNSNPFIPNSPLVAQVSLQFTYTFIHKIDDNEVGIHRMWIMGDGTSGQAEAPEWIYHNMLGQRITGR